MKLSKRKAEKKEDQLDDGAVNSKSLDEEEPAQQKSKAAQQRSMGPPATRAAKLSISKSRLTEANLVGILKIFPALREMRLNDVKYMGDEQLLGPLHANTNKLEVLHIVPKLRGAKKLLSLFANSQLDCLERLTYRMNCSFLDCLMLAFNEDDVRCPWGNVRDLELGTGTLVSSAAFPVLMSSLKRGGLGCGAGSILQSNLKTLEIRIRRESVNDLNLLDLPKLKTLHMGIYCPRDEYEDVDFFEELSKANLPMPSYLYVLQVYSDWLNEDVGLMSLDDGVKEFAKTVPHLQMLSITFIDIWPAVLRQLVLHVLPQLEEFSIFSKPLHQNLEATRKIFGVGHGPDHGEARWPNLEHEEPKGRIGFRIRK